MSLAKSHTLPAVGIKSGRVSAVSKQKKQYYAVRIGREPGIYRTWDECKAQVNGYAKAQYKGFGSFEEAEAYLGNVKANKPDRARTSGARPFNPPGAPKKKRGTVRSDDEAKAIKMLQTNDGLKHVVIYTDGACLGNPGPGGYGVVLLHGKDRKEFSRGFRLTTTIVWRCLPASSGCRRSNSRAP